MTGLYIHIPFCLQKCYYCDFLSFAGLQKKTMHDYAEAVCLQAKFLPDNIVIDTIFIGGGTPSILPSHEISLILAAVKERVNLSENCEMTIEANPGTLSLQKLIDYRKMGINRISLGAQTLQSQLLKEIGRVHDAEQVFQSIEWMKEAGFTNINVDLMVGLPGQTMQMIEEDIKRLCKEDISHVSVYALIVEENTVIGQKIASGEMILPDEDFVAASLEVAAAKLEKYELKQYEISNFAQKGMQCKHNLVYWNYQPYYALGLGASGSYFDQVQLIRTKNETDIVQYIDALRQQMNPYYIEETIEKPEQMFEFLMLGLRLNEGINQREFEHRFQMSVQQVYGNEIRRNCEKGLLIDDGICLKLTPKGMMIQNMVLLDFMR